ncbi:hypothetical protein BDZ45DRAFT_314554 [Acephala macrosclerotiorum]|nr:hypothetical protein BDZ45DRAFT_314554 [Acephala macrosclerotiorum]
MPATRLGQGRLTLKCFSVWVSGLTRIGNKQGCLFPILAGIWGVPRAGGFFPPTSFSDDSTMEDRVLSSMCIDPTSYCSFSEQGEALKQGQAARRMVSRDGNTYIHMVVPILTHWVAVQVTISPFALEKFPGQTFFSSQLRYGPCCRQIHDGGTLDAVRDTVQKVIDSFYRPVCWNYSGQW